MRQVNCYIPIKLCITGRLGDAQLDQLGEALTRAITARMEQARRTLSEHGHAPARETVASARESFDPARLSNGGYGLPSYDKGGETVTVPVAGDIEAQADPWAKLSPDGRKKAEELYHECGKWIRDIAAAQQAHGSVLRSAWLNTLSENMLGRIGNLDSDNKIQGISNSLTDYTNIIAMNVVKFYEEWLTVEERYEKQRWLLSQKSTDATEAAKRIEELYKEVKGYLDRGAINFITDEDYFVLKETLNKSKHILLGILRASRIRAKKLMDMMEVVADLRRDGEDAEKYVPDWSRRVLEETAHLDLLSKSTSEGFAPESLSEFSKLRNELLEKREEALEAHPRKREKSFLEKRVEFVAGAVEAVTGIFVEAAKEAYDLAQIALHFVSFGKYEPKFRSDMAKAAEQGATTSELLKGMVMGIIETPSRFLKACEDGDWEAIGKETVNLYFLAKTLKESPELVKNLTKTAVATTNRALRILRARTVALEIEARLLPPEPKVLTTPGGAAGEAVPAGEVPKPGAAAPERTTTKVEAEAKRKQEQEAAKQKQEQERKPREKEGTSAGKKRETGSEKEKRELREDRPQRPAKGAEYFDWEGGQSGSFRGFVRQLRAHLKTLTRQGQPHPLNERVLEQNTEAFIKSRPNLNRMWEGWTERIARQMNEIAAQRRAARGDRRLLRDLDKRYDKLEGAKSELEKFVKGDVGAKRADLIEVFLKKNRAVVTDITQKVGDPVHEFKTKFYMEVVEALTGWSDVGGLEYDTFGEQKVVD